ncbi:DUF2574 family protein, partial [Escherichia sp. HC-CC]
MLLRLTINHSHTAYGLASPAFSSETATLAING